MLPAPKLLLLRLSLLACLAFAACHSHPALFKKISSGRSGIDFNNRIIENDSVNPIDLDFLYNGGGVAVGDFNQDGLPDLYFTASQVSNKLYLNRGNFHFEDISKQAKVTGEGRWCNGASVVDINNDGWPDIYVCTTIKKDPAQRTNLLYINQGPGKDGIPVFRDMAAEYGLNDTSYSVHAAFFDYDNDGDLDLYLLTTRIVQRNAIRFNDNSDTSHIEVDKLYRNDWNDSLKHPVFTDVSKEAGIIDPGYGLGLAIADINKDGWKDIYVTNDFYGSDLLYINNKNGTFTNQLKTCIKHSSQNAMGNDVADINNDGLADIIAVDMNPADNFRKKKNMSRNNYFVYQNMVYGPYALQYVRNTLQLNQGPRMNGNDSIGEPVFAEIGFYAGVAETDWSWNPSIADFDNDGNRDIIITNGYPRDVTDHDFAAFRKKSPEHFPKQQLIDQIPQIKIPNAAFRNKGRLKFENATIAWGMEEPSFSNGAIYADLDNDGDLDYVVNNINDKAFVYENTTNEAGKTGAHFLEIRFKGDAKNINGLGAWAEIYYGNGQMQVYENSPYRGYLSTVDARAHFGLGNIVLIDSVIIRWPGNKKQVIRKLPADQLLQADIKNADLADEWIPARPAQEPAFTDISASTGIDYTHKEKDIIDFDRERLLPHKLSQYGPGLAVADLDGNGLDDIFTGGTADYPGQFFLQQPNGKFISRELPGGKNAADKSENMGLLFFDADNDGDPDLHCASGSNEFEAGSANYQDRLYVNDGKGNFSADALALPINHTSKSCIKAADFDNDGDLDLFIGGRVEPGAWPLPVSSFIYRNDSKPGAIKFTDVSNDVAKGLSKLGLVCDAIWTDFDGDGWTDLIVAGEWMPLSFFKNNHGKLENITASSGIADETGWWNSIAAGDFDNDGDMDYIVGNLGENSFYRGSHQYPVSIYAKDFDKNGIVDAIPTVFLPDEQGQLKEFPVHTRDDIVQQLPAIRKKFLTYKEFGKAGIGDLLNKDELSNALVLHANYFASSYLENLGQGRFKLHPLPVMAQLAPVYGMVVDDFNHDGNLDLALCGNDFGAEVGNGRYDAMNGLLLYGNGKGDFVPQTILQSGLFIPGDAKALVKLRGRNHDYLLAASQNRGPLKIFRCKHPGKLILISPADKTILITLNHGKTRKEEPHYGTSFLSQSSRFICKDSTIKRIEIVNNKGIKRVIE